jgi:predicted  nucleic acid-binding Zn-ribbon protein
MRKRSGSSTIKKLQDEVQQVYKAIYQGNGKPSIVTQLSNLEGKLKSHHETLESQIENLEGEIKARTGDLVNFVNDKVKNLDNNFDDKLVNLEKEMELKFKHVTEVVTERFNNISAQIASEFGRRNSENSNTWNFKTALTTSVLASLTSVAVVLLTEFLRHFKG